MNDIAKFLQHLLRFSLHFNECTHFWMNDSIFIYNLHVLFDIVDVEGFKIPINKDHFCIAQGK